MDPHCYDADPDPDLDPAQNLDADPDPDPGGGRERGRSAKNVHPPWQNPRYAPVKGYPKDPHSTTDTLEQGNSYYFIQTIQFLSIMK